MKFSVFQQSRKGGREKNEDRIGYCYTRDAGLLMVADGMGGHPQGEVAAQIALEVMASLFKTQAQPTLADPQAFLSSAVLAAHQRILRHAQDQELRDTPRTTLVAALVQNDHAYWLHCGDSRLYWVRQGELLVRTRDHSYLEQRTSAQGFDQSMRLPNRNVLFTCLGSPNRPEFEIGGPLPLLHRDRLLLCSDGLWSSVDDRHIVRSLHEKPLAQAAAELVDSALLKAGTRSDNVSVVAMEWDRPPPSRDGENTQPLTLPLPPMTEDFRSTVHHDGWEPLAVELDDEAIERNIAEINEAIRKSERRSL